MIPPWLPAPECPYSPATFAWYRFAVSSFAVCGRSGRRIEWIREVAPALTDSVCIPPFLLCYKTRAVFAAAGSEFALGSARTDDGWSVPSYPARDNPCVRAFLCLEDEKKLAVSCRLSERGFFSISFPRTIRVDSSVDAA